jgi:hypothetical protein
MSNLLINKVLIENLIFEIRGQKVIIDADLAVLYGVTTKRLNEQVKRNINRFPADFMFQLNNKEKAEVVANCDLLKQVKFSNTLPYVFTEHGALMLASVLNSDIAINTSVQITRAFVKMRTLLASHKALAEQITKIEEKVSKHDENFKEVFDAIRKLILAPEPKNKNKIGFQL